MTETHRTSVVVPTRDRPDALPATMQGLARQRVDGLNVELIVVNNGNDPAARELAQQLVDRHPWPARLLTERRPGAAAARNAGVGAASGSLIVFLNDDVVPAGAGWLAGHVGAHARAGDPDLGVLGRVTWHPDHERTAVMRWLADAGVSHDYRRIARGERDPSQVYANNLSLPRRLLEGVGGFDDRFASYGWQEYDLFLRLDDVGFRVVLDDALLGWHLHRHDLTDSLARMRRIGRTTVTFNRLHAHRTNLKTPRTPRYKASVGRLLGPVAARVPIAERLPARPRHALYFGVHKLALWHGIADGSREERAA